MSKSVQQWLVDWVQTLEDWEIFAPPGLGITAKETVKSLLHPRIKKRNPSLGLRAVVQPAAIRRYLEDCDRDRAVIAQLLRLAREALDELVAEAKAQQLNLTLSSGAPKILRALGSAWAEGHVMTAEELGNRSAEFLAGCVAKERKPDRARFATLQGYYDEQWQHRGQRNLDAVPYSSYDLGDDVKPPLIAAASRENMFLGLNRSVYARFSNATRDPYVVGSSDEIARREIDRACEELGLKEVASKVLLASLRVGLAFGPGGQDWDPPQKTPPFHDWANDTTPLAPLKSDHALDDLPRGDGIHEPLAALCQALMARLVFQEPVGELLRADERVHEGVADAMCRAWDEVHKVERSGRCVTGQEARRIVQLSILQGIKTGQEIRCILKAEAESEPQPAVFEDRPSWMIPLVAWVDDNPDIISLVRRNDPTARETYAKVAAVRGLPTLSELESFLGVDDE